jgi:hypothetical protein
MFKTQFKTKGPFEAWQTAGNYGTEAQAIQMALQKKNQGAILVRVTNKSGAVIYSS